MPDRIRRWICRTVFLAVAVAPTVCSCTWIVYRVSPLGASARRAHWQQQLEIQLGLQATVARVEHPRGGVVLLRQVSLTDPDSQRRVLQTRLIELAQTAQGWVVLLSQAEIDEGQLIRLWEILHERILRGGRLAKAVQISAAETTLHDRPTGLTFTDVRCTVEPAPLGTQAVVDFRVAGLDMPAAARLGVTRQRQRFPPRTRWQLQTGATPLPCSLFAEYCPPLSSLGGDCRFQGTVWAEKAPDGWQGELAGRFLNVDLQNVIEPFPHKWSGRAELVLRQARFQGGRLREADGFLRSGGGVIGSSLIAKFAQAFQLQASTRPSPGDEPFRAYTEFAVGFYLAAAGLRLEGLCEGGVPGVLLADRSGPLLAGPPTEPVAAVALARALSPGDQWQVPATAEADLLLRALPLPASEPPPTLTADRPQASLRLKTE